MRKKGKNGKRKKNGKIKEKKRNIYFVMKKMEVNWIVLFVRKNGENFEKRDVVRK